MKQTTILRAAYLIALVATAAFAALCADRASAQTSFGKMQAAQKNAPEAPEFDEKDGSATKNDKSKPTSATSNAANKRQTTATARIQKNEPTTTPNSEENPAQETRQGANVKPAERSQNARIKPRVNEKDDPKNAEATADSEFGPSYGKPVTHKYRAGMMFQAQPGGTCVDVLGTAPVPMEFPEQKVRTLAEDFPSKGRVEYRDLKEGGARQLVFKLRELKAGEGVEATSLFEVVRYPVIPPENTDLYEIPKQVPYELRRYLKDGKYMQSSSKTIRSLAKETTKDVKTAWEKIDAILAYVRTNIQYKELLVEKQMRGALDALKTRDGDCEDMSALFIAMCRAIDVPARLVRVPGHCWAEFYLVDPNKKGYWFPAQVAGTDRLGELQDTRVILQKGDSFRLPETPKEEKLYVTELFTGTVKNGGPEPNHVFIQETDGK